MIDRCGDSIDRIVYPQNSYVEAITPKMMEFVDGAFGRQSDLYEVMGVGLV